ncbi:MAG: hypothetical protein AAF415_12610 [Pseudomonadota bacterium]
MGKKRLILVVHGIGEQAPGECLGLLTSSMPVDRCEATSYDIERLSEEDGAPLDDPSPPADIPCQFECHSRRLRTPDTDHIFAEVYWSDVVVTGRGTLAILFSLVRVILGLGHIVRESAAVTYDNHPLMRRLSDTAIYCIHGPIAAMNTVLLIGAVIASAARASMGDAMVLDFRWALVVTVPVAAYALLQRRSSVSYLWRGYWLWLILSSVLLALAAIALWYLSVTLPTGETMEGTPLIAAFCGEGADFLRQSLCRTGRLANELEREALSFICIGENLLTGGNQSCKNELKGIYLLGVLLLLAQQGAWMLTFILMTAILVVHMLMWVRVRVERHRRHIPSLAPVALSAMALFWILLLCCFWAVGFFIDESFTGNYQLFKAAFFLVWVNWAFSLALASATALIYLGPQAAWKRRVKPLTYFAEPDGSPDAAPRLIVAQPIALITMFCPVALLMLATISVMRDQGVLFYDVSWMNWLANLAYQHFKLLLAISALVGVALYAFRDWLRVGIDLGSDVINYFRVLEYHPDPQRREFYMRERIERRFIAVARAMVSRHLPDEVMLVAHSQGTVVALDVLRHKKIPELMGHGAPWTLITMGSPFTHIYGHYFPRQFVVPGRVRTGLAAWINIFRINDFVGTHIRPRNDPKKGSWPEEHAVGPRGHTNYWIDREVVPILRRHLFD